MKNDFGKVILGMLIITVGFAFIIVGVNDGEILTVFNKAVNICMECIGIG